MFTKLKKKKPTQTQKRNARERLRIMTENLRVIEEGRIALRAVNVRLVNEARAAAGLQDAMTSDVRGVQKPENDARGEVQATG